MLTKITRKSFWCKGYTTNMVKLMRFYNHFGNSLPTKTYNNSNFVPQVTEL